MQKINVKNLLRTQKTGQGIRPLHIILGNRNLEKFGEIINIPADSITYHPQFNAVDEFSFNVYKEKNDEVENLWDKIIDIKTVYVKEYDEWFEITVSVDESEKNTKKLITAKSLCEAELGQVILHDIEINTEDDIARKEYTEPTIFYNPDKKDSSLLDRIFEKAPGYTIAHVDETLLKIQRSFSIDGTSIYDFLTSTLSQEIGCIFLFDSNTRSVYVYDMETCCLDCGYRSEDAFTICPECGGTILHEPHGKDTSIFVDKNNLGSEIQLTSETDSVKNCFRVIGGDDLINATLKNINPNGSNYIYYFNQDTLSDMPDELQSKIKLYDELVNEYTNNKSFSLEASLVNQYNDIIEYIKKYYPETTYSSIKPQYIGWSNITSVYYDVIDLYSYLNSSMIPTWKQENKTAASQLALLTPSNLSPVAVTDVSKISVYTANNAVLAMAKAIIDTSIYKVEILDGSALKSQTWTGRFKLTNYSDSEDTAEMKDTISIEINDDYIAYVNQQVDKAMGKVNDQGLQNIYNIEDINKFKEEIHKYSAQRLTSYQSAYQSAINILTEQGVASNSSDLHDSIYLPYYERFIALEAELSYRNSQLDTIAGLEKYIEDLISKTHNELDFESYIGEEYWKLFTYYRREDDYSNDNYISDGLTNAELIDKANELLVVAKKELVKSGEKQFTISGTLQNLLLLTDKDGNRIFEPILDDFTLGNFIRAKIDGNIYVMRLADISISYGDLSKLSVTFSDAYRYGSPDVNIVKDILTKSQSMASSYSSTVKQASQGEKANLTFEKLQKEGLDSALYNVHNTNSTAVFDEHGILIRSYDDVLGDYKDEQSRFNVNELVYTTDKWRTAVTALGKQKYTLNGTTYEKYGLNTDFVISGLMIAGDIYSANYSIDSNGNCIGTHFNLNTGDCVIGGDKIIYDAKNNKLSVNADMIDLTGKVTFNSFSSALQENWQDIKDMSSDANDKATEALNSVEKSIESVDLEYYKSSSSTELKDGSWISEPPEWTQGCYIWSRQKTTCQDGTISYSEAACITGNNGKDGYTPRKGVDYFDGNDGTSNYIWIRYATDLNGSDMVSTPSSSTTYIGTAITTSASAPTSPSEYVWSKYVGSDGIPGTNGIDGKTTYLHIAYANSADGKTGFDTTNGSDKEYIGQYTDTTLEDSTDPDKYTWSLIKGEDGIGITKLQEEYYLSTSDSGLVDGSWSSEPPKWVEGHYIWTRTHIYWDDDTDTTSEPILAKALNGANENAVEAKKTAQNIIDNIYTTNTTTINGGKITTGTVTADAIATDAIVSKNYVEGSTGSFLNLADGTFDSKYLKWDETGAITATSGHIGGWIINKIGLFGISDVGTVTIYSPSTEQDTIISVTDTTTSTPSVAFLLSKNGKLKATNVDIQGVFKNVSTTTEGYIMTTTISGGQYLIKNSNNSYFYIQGHIMQMSKDEGKEVAWTLGRNSVSLNVETSLNGNTFLNGTTYVNDNSSLKIYHTGRKLYGNPVIYTDNPISFDWDGSVLRIYVDNTIVASWIWGEQRWE